jgi:site-specific recombinase XerC
MTDAKKISERLSAYLDGELSDAERARVEAALEQDPQLVRLLAQLRATRKLLHGLDRSQAGEDFVSRVMARVERRDLLGRSMEMAAPQARHWTRWLAAAAVLLVTAGVGVFVATVINSPDFTELANREAKTLSSSRAEKSAEEYATNALAKSESPVMPQEKEDAIIALAPARESKELPLSGSSSLAAAPPTPQAAPPAIRIVIEGKTPPATKETPVALAKMAEKSEEAAEIPEAPSSPPEPEKIAPTQVVIRTDSLLPIQREVEEIMAKNRVAVVPAESMREEDSRRIARQREQNTMNYTQLNAPEAEQIRYVAYLDEPTKRNVQTALDELTRRQYVSQQGSVPVLSQSFRKELLESPATQPAEPSPTPPGDKYVAVEAAPDGRLRRKALAMDMASAESLEKPPEMAPEKASPVSPPQYTPLVITLVRQSFLAPASQPATRSRPD